jgi:hypothetical protein
MHKPRCKSVFSLKPTNSQPIHGPNSPNHNCRFWGINRKTLHQLGFETQVRNPQPVLRLNREKSSPPVLRPSQKNRRHRFWGQTGENHLSGFEVKPLRNCTNDFEDKPLTNRRPWFWDSKKKLAPIVSMCTVQTVHSVTRPPDRSATEYPTYVTIPDPLYQVFYSCYDPHRCLSWRTYHLHTMRQANTILHMNKIKVVEPPKYPRFEFKSRQVNNSSQSNQAADHLVSQCFICGWVF